MSNDNSDLPEVFDNASRNIVSRVVDLRINKTDLIDLVVGEVTAEISGEVEAAEQAFEEAKRGYLKRIESVATRHFRGLINQLQKHADDGVTIRLVTEAYGNWRARRGSNNEIFTPPHKAYIKSYRFDNDDDDWDYEDSVDVSVRLPEATDSIKQELAEVLRLGRLAFKLRNQFNNLTQQTATVKRQMTRNILESTQDGLAVLEQLASVRQELKSRIRNPEKKIRVA